MSAVTPHIGLLAYEHIMLGDACLYDYGYHTSKYCHMGELGVSTHLYFPICTYKTIAARQTRAGIFSCLDIGG